MQTSSDLFLQSILGKLKRGWVLFPGHIFRKIFHSNFSFVILRKLVKSHCQTEFTSHVIQ